MSNDNKSFKQYCVVTAKALGMGVAEVIPGISGGTIAFITGIYEDLINAIKSVNIEFAKKILTLKWKEAFSIVHWKFLLAVAIGNLVAIKSLAKIISWLIHNHPTYLFAFFFGLILATIPIIARVVQKWDGKRISLAVIFTIGTYFFVGMVPVSTPNTPLFLFFSGMIAISAMILPGISGSFILVILGKYLFILDAINHHDFASLAYLGAGICVGILIFVRVLSYLFTKFHDTTLACLTGLVIGSLNKIWPWKETVRSIEGRQGKIIPVEQINILPDAFTLEIVWVLLICLVGFAVACALNSDPKKISL